MQNELGASQPVSQITIRTFAFRTSQITHTRHIQVNARVVFKSWDTYNILFQLTGLTSWFGLHTDSHKEGTIYCTHSCDFTYDPNFTPKTSNNKKSTLAQFLPPNRAEIC